MIDVPLQTEQGATVKSSASVDETLGRFRSIARESAFVKQFRVLEMLCEQL